MHDCVSQGLAVVQGDGDTDLAIYPDDSFDYVILSQTIQAMRQPLLVLENMLRIGRYGIVTFTNYAHWRVRWYFMRRGACRWRGSAGALVPHRQHPPLHPRGLRALCAELGLRIERAVPRGQRRAEARLASNRWLDNLFSEQALFLLSRPKQPGTPAQGGRGVGGHQPPCHRRIGRAWRRLTNGTGGIDLLRRRSSAARRRSAWPQRSPMRSQNTGHLSRTRQEKGGM